MGGANRVLLIDAELRMEAVLREEDSTELTINTCF